MSGTIGILNVGAGDTKLVFDKNNPAECIRAARVVKDMLRRGYALLIEVGGGKKGEKKYQRVHDFKEDTCEYIIADLDPVEAEKFYKEEEREQNEQTEDAGAQAPSQTGKTPRATRGRGRTRAVAASTTRGVAVARTAGG